MKQFFELKETNRNVRETYRLNLNIPNYNQVTFGKYIWTKNLERFTVTH